MSMVHAKRTLLQWNWHKTEVKEFNTQNAFVFSLILDLRCVIYEQLFYRKFNSFNFKIATLVLKNVIKRSQTVKLLWKMFILSLWTLEKIIYFLHMQNFPNNLHFWPSDTSQFFGKFCVSMKWTIITCECFSQVLLIALSLKIIRVYIFLFFKFCTVRILFAVFPL